MIKFVKYFYFLIILILSSRNTSDKKSQSTALVKKSLAYSIDTSGIVVSWPAYKFTKNR